MIAKRHEDRWTKLVSNWNPAISTEQKGYHKQGRPAKRWEDDFNIYSQPDRSNRDKNDLTSDMTWLKTAEDSSKWDAQAHVAWYGTLQIPVTLFHLP